MTAKRGSTLLLKVGDGGGSEVFTTVGTMQTKSVAFNGSEIDVTTGDDVDGEGEIWGDVISGVKTITINGTGIAKTDSKTVLQGLYDDWAKGTIRNFQIIIPYLGTHTVAMLIMSMNFDGPHDGVLSFTLNARNAGAPSFTAEA